MIVVATESHRDRLLPRLQAYGLNIGAAIEQGRYISLDAGDTISTFMVNDQLDPVRFSRATVDLILGAAKKGKFPRVAVCGECAPLLWAQGHAEAAVRLEHLWDGIAKTLDLDVSAAIHWVAFRAGSAARRSKESVQNIQPFIPGKSAGVEFGGESLFSRGGRGFPVKSDDSCCLRRRFSNPRPVGSGPWPLTSLLVYRTHLRRGT